MIVLFGGAFDPFHNGHLAVIEAIENEATVDRIILIPAAAAPGKSQTMLSDEHRFSMIQQLCSRHEKYEASSVELDRGGVSWSIDTVTHCRDLYPNFDLGLVVGSDQFFEFHTWRDYEKILKYATLLVVNRGDVPDKNSYEAYQKKHIPARASIRCISMAPVPISATMIRKRMVDGESVQSLVPAEVYRYLLSHSLVSS